MISNVINGTTKTEEIDVKDVPHIMLQNQILAETLQLQQQPPPAPNDGATVVVDTVEYRLTKCTQCVPTAIRLCQQHRRQHCRQPAAAAAAASHNSSSRHGGHNDAATQYVQLLFHVPAGFRHTHRFHGAHSQPLCRRSRQRQRNGRRPAVDRPECDVVNGGIDGGRPDVGHNQRRTDGGGVQSSRRRRLYIDTVSDHIFDSVCVRVCA